MKESCSLSLCCSTATIDRLVFFSSLAHVVVRMLEISPGALRDSREAHRRRLVLTRPRQLYVRNSIDYEQVQY